MTKTQQVYRAFIVVAHATAVLAALIGLLGLLVHDDGPPDWRQSVSWETVGIVSFLAYAVFVMLPVQRFRPSAFWLAVAVGAALAVGSTWMSKGLYDIIAGKALDGAIVCHVLAWILLIPFYAYIPIMILNRRHGAASNRLNPKTEGTPSVEG